MSVSAEAGGLSLVTMVTAADTRAIEAGLNRLWRMAEAGEIGSLIRTASLTLVVPLQSEAAADELMTIVGRLTQAHPGRVIAVVLTDAVSEASARLASHSRSLAEGEASRYWEEVRLFAPPGTLHRVMSAVTTLVLPGLPVQTWWPEELVVDEALYNHVVEISDRLVVDTSRVRDPLAALAALANAIEIAQESVAFADLSWARLTPWRTLTAEFFDAPADQDMLDSIERVAIVYAPSTGGESAQALLLAGWLGSRLGWEASQRLATGPGAWRFEMIDGVRPVAIEIEPVAAEGPPGLRSISIEATERGRTSRYLVELCGEDEARTVKEDGARLEGPARLPRQETVDLLGDELTGFATDRIYHESLAVVVSMLRASDG
ncbi:MAG: glucose-6-phosphate dehydrogenase assembly protein OpcA [Chloroflexi bacterium]|nr:glucose-6-phosphate dehydrogenase assembly protein OpcA [Chloroflexota bacterium]